jgi:hypothetical protein
VDVRRYKFALPLLAPLAGSRSSIALHPLSEAQVTAAHQAALERFARHGCEADGSAFVLEVQLQSLARAAHLDAQELREGLTREEVMDLFDAWQRAARELVEDEAALRTWVRKRVNDDWEIHHDGAAAYAAEEGPSAFYGRPLVDLTRGQVLYYWLVRGAFSEWYGPDVTKQPTRQWLESA